MTTAVMKGWEDGVASQMPVWAGSPLPFGPAGRGLKRWVSGESLLRCDR